MSGSKAVAENEIALLVDCAVDLLIGTFVHKQKQAKNCAGQLPLRADWTAAGAFLKLQYADTLAS